MGGALFLSIFRRNFVISRLQPDKYHGQYSMQTWGTAKIITLSTSEVRHIDRAEHVVLGYSKAMSLLKLPAGEKQHISELKAHRFVLHCTTMGSDTVVVWPAYGKGLIGEWYHFCTGEGHLFIHTDGCWFEFSDWNFCKLFDTLVQWKGFHSISWCFFIKGHPYAPEPGGTGAEAAVEKGSRSGAAK